MSFEVFIRPPGGRQMDKTMKVRVGAGGQFLHLNTKAFLALGSPARVLLLRDGESIAFQATEPDDPRGFNCPRGNISCRAFTERVGLESGMKLVLRFEDGLLRTDGLS